MTASAQPNKRTHTQEDTHVSHQTHEALSTVLGAIIDGEYDDVLDRLAAAVNERRKLVNAQAARRNVLTIMPGARVKLHGLSPKYLNGLVGTVVETPEFRRNRRKATLSVNLDTAPYGRFGKVVNVPAACLTALD
jgi:hypothetical protein